jgi:glycosyltransferase involved in cell wall biosynthesis
MNKQNRTEETTGISIVDRLKLTKRMIGYWGDMNHIEPMIRTSWDILAYIPVLSQHIASPLIEKYATFCKQFKDYQFTDIILVPHLVRGGADLTALNLARALESRGEKTLVIATVDVGSPWRSLAEKIPNLEMIELHKELHGMGQDQIMRFCLNVVRGWSVSRISVINSEVGYRLAAETKSLLKQLGCRLYLHTYAYDMTEDGYIFNMIPNGIVKAYPGVDALVTDSKSYARQLKEINGFESSKTKVLYQPIESKVVKKTDYSRKNKILWAGRVGDAKLVEVMVEVGRRLSESGIELHVFGAIDPPYRENDRFLGMINSISSIKYHGSYDGFGSIDTNCYDLFLMTTKNEGMPNVVLEAGKAGIYTVAPGVGGIPECIQDGKNGSLVNVEDRFTPDAYLKCILDAYQKDLCFAKKEINKTNRNVLKEHTLEAYIANAQRITR